MWRLLRVPAVAVAAVAGTLILSNLNALAYSSGSVGYDVGYLQCSTSASGSFGIVGVDSGWPFISSLHPGNPCLSSEYAQASQPALYVNTGFDPSYTDSNHTTPACATSSGAVTGSASQKAAWAAGCSEAQKDLAYVQLKGIGAGAQFWLDVELANSWCGQSGTNCTDLTLNQFSLQGVVDTLHAAGFGSVGVYSTSAQWRAIVGAYPVTGVQANWVATGVRTAKRAAVYCRSSFTGAPVTLVQFLGSYDRDSAC